MNDKNIPINNPSTDESPVALITGAARRIGNEITKTLHEAGYRVIIHCNKSRDEADSLASKLNQLRNNSAYVVAADLTTSSGCQSVISQTVSFADRLDVLINNASAFFPTAVADVTEDEWQQLFATNLRAPFMLAQLATAELNKSSGSIVNITDIHGTKPLSGYSVYSMTKAGLISMTLSLAKELAPDIRVNGVSPGAILWPEHEKESSVKHQEVISRIPLKRMGTAHNIAETVKFLLENDYITGQIINVDGGRSVVQ